ncbi:RHS repeat-associated core domain-containing protein [Virgisporangium aurantiacum]|uniref:RHS repeat-associated core domain-containing protein n=1 Tax=Virgisporangium aurantiacum TaxID=175570 RepID=A0A8J4E7C9_9ACTN|nr:RHS repeat-associated core domain-containing protein [Virgisporangium aurantiacum]GIJ64406.1 hypothetical protein Vau01_119220 [Virgisporangium aurantiacum]
MSAVTVRDLTGGSPDEVWNYSYSTQGSSTNVLWGHDNTETVPVGKRSWTVFRGYSTVSTIHGDTTGTRTESARRYFRGLNGDRTDAGDDTRTATISDSQGNVFTDVLPLAGQTREEMTIENGVITGSVLHNVTTAVTSVRTRTYQGGNITAYYLREPATITRTKINATNSWRVTETQTVYENNYNLTTDQADLGDTATIDDDTCSRTTYAMNTTDYLIAMPSEATTRAGTNCASGSLLARSRTYYDGQATHGAPPTQGLATKAESLVSTGPDVWATTQAGYDIYGRPVSAKDARGKTSTVAYTPATVLPATQMVATNALGHTTTSTVEPRRGAPTAVVDANGRAITVRYDPLGRLVKVWGLGRPTSGTPTAEYVYTLAGTAGGNSITTKMLGPNGNQIVSYDLFDGRLRLRQTQQPAPQANGGRIITDTAYDSRGLAVKASTFWNSAAPDATLVAFADTNIATQNRKVFDQQERVINDQLWSLNTMKWQTITGYDGDRTTVTPPAGGIPTTTLVDAHGRTTELRQHLGATTADPYQTTGYGYDRLGRMAQVTDPAGNTWASTYDFGGRVTATTDPDRGATEMTYTAAGDLATTKDARDIVLSYRYDDLGRRTELWQGAVGTGTKRATWGYDTLASGGSVKGQPVRSTRWHPNSSGVLEAYSSEVTDVDDAYRPLTRKVSLPSSMGSLAGPWTTSTSYTPDGNLATQTLPAGGSLPAETITHTYDNAGYPLTMAGIDTYISNTTYTNLGVVTGLTLGVGTKRVQLDNAIDPATGRLTENRVSTENQTSPGTWVPQLIEQYGYDAAGNVKNINEVNNSGTTVSNQCFKYDALRRLAEAWTTTAATCQAAPTQAIVGGPDPYWTSYQHNAIGNRTQDTVHTAAGNTIRTYAYPASGPTSVRPHAATGVTITGVNPGSDTYGYDATGNTTTRNIAGKAGQALTWDEEGHLASVTDSSGTTSYVYTPDGQRLLAYEPGSVTTLYLEGFELRRTTAGITCTRHYGVAVRTTNGGLTWTAADHHGTGQAAINPATLAVTRRKTDPYGNARGPAAGWPTTRGFVNGVNDPTGLVHLGAREYEPATGRFISVDPVMDLNDPGHWNGYTYANSNPVTDSDPDGLAPICKKPDGEDCHYSVPGGGDPCAGGCGVTTSYTPHWGSDDENPYKSKLKGKLGNLLLKDWQQRKYMEAIEAVDKYASKKGGNAHMDFAAVVAKVEVDGELQVVVFASFSIPEDLIDELQAMGVTVYVANDGPKNPDDKDNHAEGVAKQWRFDMEQAKKSVKVFGAVVSNESCSDTCAENLTYFAFRKDGTGPQIEPGGRGFEGDRMFTPQWVRSTRSDIRKEEKAKDLPKRSINGMNAVLTWFRYGFNAGDSLAQARQPQIRGGGPGMGGPQQHEW